MDDHPTPLWAGQERFQFLLPDDTGRPRYRVTFPLRLLPQRLPDVTIALWPARTELESGHRISIHIEDRGTLVFVLDRIVVSHRAIPTASIDGTRDDAGTIVPHLRTHDGVPYSGIAFTDAQKLMSVWDDVWENGEVAFTALETVIGNKPATVSIQRREPHDWPRADYIEAWRKERPRHRSRGAIVRAMAARTGVHERTIRRWPEWYDYPLFETVEEYDARIGHFLTFPGHGSSDVEA